MMERKEAQRWKEDGFVGRQRRYLHTPKTSLSTGYYYELDESYDESDEEEVKAHLRRVTEQPPLKLDTSSEVHKHGRLPM